MKIAKRILYAIVCLIFCVLAVCSNSSKSAPDDDNTPANLPTETEQVNTQAPTEGTEPTVETTKAVQQTQQDPNEWKQAYLNLLESKKDNHFSYSLVFIDGDDIPDLYMSGDCEATGDGVYVYRNGSIVEQRLNRIGGGYYIPKAGEIMNRNGNMGHYFTQVYKLTDDGFVMTFCGVQKEHVESSGDDYELYYEYTIDDEVVSENEFNAAVESAFDQSRSLDLYGTADYEQIKNWIINY